MNYNNLSQRTNYTAGSDAFENISFFLTNVNIPGFNLGHTQVGGRGSTKMFVSADVVSWNILTLDMLIDEDFKVYNEVMGIIRKNINVNTGNFANFVFDFWIELNNNKGNHLMKLNFKNCRIDSVGDITLDVQDEMTEHTMNISLLYDYYEIESNNVPVILP